MKKSILEILIKNTDKYISGEELSNKFSVSRTAIWKVINNLKKQGYEIESISGKGYRLINFSKILNEDELSLFIKSKRHKYNFICLNTVDSTNNYLKKMANEGVKEWTIIFSEEQTNGRGRLGKNWETGFGNNIAMSILLKPNILPYQAAKITQIAAAAVYLALKEVIKIETKIKWPNDIVYDGKKVCGILTEMTGELNAVNYVILGIGINVNGEKFPEEIKNIATSVKIIKKSLENIDRKEVIKSFLNNFERLYYSFVDENYIDESISICRNNSAILNKNVNLIRSGKIFNVKVVDINQNGELIIENEEGKIEVVMSGEVSIRKEDLYI